MIDLSAIRLRQLGSSEVDKATEFVRAYYAHDGLVFDSHVERAVRELVQVPGWGCFWAIEQLGTECGYIVLTFGFDHEFGGRIGVVTDFYLEPSVRGRGIGSRVLNLIAEEARALCLRRIELAVLEHNPDGRRFYERAGFRPIGGRQTMALPLNELGQDR